MSYHCRVCRYKLCDVSDTNPHSPGEGQNSFSIHKRDKSSAVNCTAIFMKETMEWMGELGESEGKLLCTKCSGRVGSYCWYGQQCSCGHWCNPALQILKSRVDFKDENSILASRQPIFIPNINE